MPPIFEKILSDPFNSLHPSDEVRASMIIVAIFLIVLICIIMGMDK